MEKLINIMPKRDTYKVTMPDGNVETYKNEFDMPQMTVLQDIAEDLVYRFGYAAGCKVQRVKEQILPMEYVSES